MLRSVPGAVATGSSIHAAVELDWTITRSLPLPVLTSSYDRSAPTTAALWISQHSCRSAKSKSGVALRLPPHSNLLIFPARRGLSKLIQHLKKNVELWRIAGNLAHSLNSLFSELRFPLLDQRGSERVVEINVG